ncbi:hypothetical protein LCGC14_2287430 [marine sediment metagenome]|uniref:Uncharacterized protein n=1 Tax=marine sediment metagenome TaxID=412755 RepID=A0A0F9DET3_9ZZZZ
MTPIERQLLKNQVIIMESVFFKGSEDTNIRIEETRELLNPNVIERLCCGMSEVEKSAYEFGKSRVRDGADKANCHFTIFSTPETTKAWEKGVEFAKRGRE